MAEKLASPDLDAVSVKLSYDSGEDRIRGLFGLAGGEVAQLWLSRRLTRLLLRHLTQLIERTSRTSKRAASADRQTVLAFEHEAAVKAVARLQQARARPKAVQLRSSGPSGRPLPQGICSAIEAVVGKGEYCLVFRDRQGVGLRLKVTRPVAHWLIDALLRNAASGEWDLVSSSSWLMANASSSSPN